MHHSTAVILEDVTNHYNHLVDEHQKLHKEIQHCQYYAPDADLKQLKVQKLRLKDEIQLVRTKLELIIK